MKLYLRYSFLLLVFGCATTQKSNEFYEFDKRTRLIPKEISEIAGHYEAGFMFSGDVFDLSLDSTFVYRYWSDVITGEPVKSYHGRYFVSSDSIVFVFAQYEYSNNAPKDKIEYFQNSLLSKIRLTRLSEKYSPCVIKKINNDLFLFQHDQIEELRKDFRNLEKVTKVLTLGTGQRVSLQTLMKINHDNTN